MNENVQKALYTLEHGSVESIWESAKYLESSVNDIFLQLLRSLTAGDNAETRAAAAYVLGFVRCATARIPLEEILKNSKQDSRLRGHAAEALGYIADPRSQPVLLDHFLEGDDRVRYWCAFALGELADLGILPTLEKAAQDGSDVQPIDGLSLRDEVLEAISKIKKRANSNR